MCRRYAPIHPALLGVAHDHRLGRGIIEHGFLLHIGASGLCGCIQENGSGLLFATGQLIDSLRREGLVGLVERQISNDVKTRALRAMAVGRLPARARPDRRLRNNLLHREGGHTRLFPAPSQIGRERNPGTNAYRFCGADGHPQSMTGCREKRNICMIGRAGLCADKRRLHWCGKTGVLSPD